MKHFIYLLPLIFIFSFKQSSSELSGTYYYVDNEFEKLSIMTLNSNNTFLYKCHLGGCQYNITGTYRIKGKKVYFTNDEKFTPDYIKNEVDSLVALDSMFSNITAPFMIDLSLVEWKIKKNSIKPISEVDCGCFIEKGKHIKR